MKTNSNPEELEPQGDQRQPAMHEHGGLANTTEIAISFIKRIINLDGLEGAHERKRIINASRKLRKKYLKKQRSGFYMYPLVESVPTTVINIFLGDVQEVNNDVQP